MPLLGNTVKARKRAVPGKTSSNGKCAANAAALATALPACAAASSAIDMNEEARSERSVSHRSTRSEIPTSDQIEKYNLPTNYRIKYCRLCDNGSLTTCDYVEVGTAWGLLLLWGNGTRACPSGVYCRICKYVYCNGGFNVLYDTIQDYTTAIHKNPSLHHEFLDARRKWISMKIEDPTLKLRGSSDLVPPRLVDIEQIQEDEMEGEVEYFMLLDTFVKKFGQPAKEKIVKRTFRGKTMEGVMVVKEEDEGMFKITKKQKHAVTMSQRMSDLELRPGQADDMFSKAVKSLLSACGESNEDFVLLGSSSASSVSSSRSANIILNTAALNKDGNDGEADKITTRAHKPEERGEANSDDEVQMSSSGLLKAFASAMGSEPSSKAAARPKAKPKAASKSGAGNGRKRKAEASASDELPGSALLISDLQTPAPRGHQSSADDETGPNGTKRGRASQQQLAETDGRFAEEMRLILQQVTDCKSSPMPTTSELDLVNFARLSASRCSEVMSKCANKSSQMKRRKTKDDDASDKVSEYQQTATMFYRFFNEISSSAPRPAELANAMAQVTACGYVCGNMCTMKLLKAKVFDFVKYTCFSDITICAAEIMSKEMPELPDQDFFKHHYGLILEQVMQKLLRTLPPANLKLNTPTVAHLRLFLEAVSKDQVILSETSANQIKALVKIFSMMDDKTILLNQVLNAVALVREGSDEYRMFQAMKSLPQGNILLNEAHDTAQKRIAADKSLEHLAAVTTKIDQLDAKTEMSTSELIEIWSELVKVETMMQDKPGSANLPSLHEKLKEKAQSCIQEHIESEFASYIASQLMHATNKMKSLECPAWNVLGLCKYMSEESIFRHHATIKKCCDALELGWSSGESLPIPLQKVQTYMDDWDKCEHDLTKSYPAASFPKLHEALTNFGKYFGEQMQKGFKEKKQELHGKMVNLLQGALVKEPASSIWPDLLQVTEDYMRLGTSDVFSEEERKEMHIFGQATSIFRQIGFNGLAYSEAPAVLKISAKPSPESTSMFSALKEMKAGIASMEKFGEPSVPDILCGHGVDEKVKPLIVVLKTKFAEWSSDFSNKIGEQSQKMAETLASLQLPTYNPDDHNSSVKQFMAKASGLEKIAEIVAKLKAFVAAATTCCSLAGMDSNISAVSSALTEGKTFLYISTVLTVLSSPTWSSMTPELAKKTDTKHGQLCKHLEYALTHASNDGISLPGEIQSKAAELMAIAGLEV